MEARLSALEKAITDPAQHGSLESLILELARIATKEADATARNAVLDAHNAGQQAAAAARKEATAALEAEKVESAALRQVIEGAKAALKQAEAALKEERRATEAVNREVAAARRELAVAQEALEEAQSGRVNDRREMDAALAAAEGERDNARRDLQSVRDELDAARRQLDDIRRDADTRTQTHSQSQAQQEEALRTADAAARSAAEAARAAEEAARVAEDAVRAAEARLEGAIQDRDAARNESADLKRQLEAAEIAVRESEAVNRELQAAHEARDAAEVEAARNAERHAEVDSESDIEVDLTSIAQEEERQLAIERRTRALELALRDAETRAESAEQELDRHRRAARGEPSSVQMETPPAPEPATAPESSEQFRGPARGARRVAFKADIAVLIDGNSGKLVDLSMTGAQVLTPAAINPNRLVTVTLPLGENSLVCKAKVAWSRLEPREGQLWYRAGVQFTTADQQGLESFFAMHQP